MLRFLLTIYKAYRTVSHEALYCISGIPPICLKVEEIQKLHRIKKITQYVLRTKLDNFKRIFRNH